MLTFFRDEARQHRDPTQAALIPDRVHDMTRDVFYVVAAIALGLATAALILIVAHLLLADAVRVTHCTGFRHRH